MNVACGDLITASSEGWMRGHGTVVANGELVSCVAGKVERVDKLMRVRGVNGRYVGEVGDLVVGRVLEVGPKAWRVEIGGCRRATLALSSVNLPDDEQRIRTREDALSMRDLLDVGNVVCAEVQAVRQDGTVQLHTRSNRYGRLANGHLVTVPAGLVRRLPSHFVRYDDDLDVEVAVGNNGWIWVQRAIPMTWHEELSADTGGGSSGADALLTAEAWKTLRARHAARPLDRDDDRVDRVRAAIVVLGLRGAAVTADTIEHVYRDALAWGLTPPQMSTLKHSHRLVRALLSKKRKR
ncbi:hypothetical protein CTAYLR_009939 [Chrysophaeum taylorii]|uniref:S1 motif domain-containing protein n=1 Tax=Chrysophaeum taylorii TaxID=2483200 RepID=A0AAD7UD67_9STRA|nr:hypothetical protein CTAYLR_009939 [Chrysophaeum taylorii]